MIVLVRLILVFFLILGIEIIKKECVVVVLMVFRGIVVLIVV